MNAHQKIIKDNVRSILKIITNHYGVKSLLHYIKY